MVKIIAKIAENQILGKIAFYNVALFFEVDNKKMKIKEFDFQQLWIELGFKS